MPRTKVPKTTSKNNLNGEPVINKELLLAASRKRTKELHEIIKQISKEINHYLEDWHTYVLTKVNSEVLNMTLVELKNVTTRDLSSTTKNMTKSMQTFNTKKLPRSSSYDEGYLTTESSNSLGSKMSASRGRSKAQKDVQDKPRRATRSLSRNLKSTKSGLVTPGAKRTPLQLYGTVTPKCKPNTPLVLLRRPKQGETALSFQGSPLLVHPVVQDDVANINIPLDDGTLLSLQPQKGLRVSQIPQFNKETLNQLQTLNQHLNMVLNNPTVSH